MTAQLTAPRYEKEICYDRETRDYAMYLDGELVGFARTYHEAEVSLDELVHTILVHGNADPAPAAPCDHIGTGREVLVSPSYEVLVSCQECSAMLDVLQCKDALEAKLTALRELGEPLDDRTIHRMSVAAFTEIFDIVDGMIGEYGQDDGAPPDELVTIRQAAQKALAWLGEPRYRAC
jgi:hypothetical protein